MTIGRNRFSTNQATIVISGIARKQICPSPTLPLVGGTSRRELQRRARRLGHPDGAECADRTTRHLRRERREVRELDVHRPVRGPDRIEVRRKPEDLRRLTPEELAVAVVRIGRARTGVLVPSREAANLVEVGVVVPRQAERVDVGARRRDDAEVDRRVLARVRADRSGAGRAGRAGRRPRAGSAAPPRRLASCRCPCARSRSSRDAPARRRSRPPTAAVACAAA